MQNAKSINVFHSSGWGYHTPSHADPALPPLKGPGRFLPDYEAGLDAALCVVSSLVAQLHTGRGEFIDVSAQAVLVSRADCILGRFITGDIAPENSRADYDQQGPASIFACRDGHVYLYMTNGAHWVGLKELMGRPPWLDEFDDDWLEFSVTPEKVATFHRGFAAWIADRAKDPITEKAQRIGVPLVPVNGADDLRRSPQYRHRGFFVDVTHPVLGTAAYPTVPYLMTASPAEITSPAPSLGQHTTQVGALAGPRSQLTVKNPQLKPPQTPRGGPLEGVRVVELTKVWAGPYAGKLLAFLGAEVIKVETANRPEEMRAYGGTDINHPVLPEHQPGDPVRRSRHQVSGRLRPASRPHRAQRHRDQQPAAGRDGAAGAGIRRTARDQVRHHLGVDQDVGQRRAARLPNRLCTMLRRTGGPVLARRIPGRPAARCEYAIRRLHCRRGGGVRGRRGTDASRTHRSRTVRRRIRRRGPDVDDRRLRVGAIPDR
jgi:crotonobetainyl-CoA:carnitine CoA-transferase CaiB-like acyl-CoA transferase